MDNICLRCNCKLRVFKTTLDWNSRKYHKVCYKELELERLCQIELEKYQDLLSKKNKLDNNI